MTWYYVMIAVCLLAIVTMRIHINNNTVLSKDRVIWFRLSFVCIAIGAAAECAGTVLSAYGLYPEVHKVITLIEFSLTPLVPVLLSMSYNIRKQATIVGMIELVHILIEGCMVPIGGIFRVDENGVYSRGPYYFIYIAAYVVSFGCLFLMFFIIVRNVRGSQRLTLVMIILTILSALIPSIISSRIRTAYLGLTIMAILLYVFYEDLSQKKLQQQILESNEEMSRELIRTLSYAMEAKDEYTRGHSSRVADYSRVIAERMGYSEARLKKLHLAATLHDIGKLGIPDSVLNKPGRLTKDEFNIIKMHPTIGADILKNVDALSYAEKVARYHHERYDGMGYPEGLKGREIPEEARIVALADSYDAMSSRRVYRRTSLTEEQIREQIEINRGLQFDPEIADVFLEALSQGMFDEIRDAGKEDDNGVGELNVDTARKELSNAVSRMFTDTDEEDMPFARILSTVENFGNYEGALRADDLEFAKLFSYVENLCSRYHHNCYMVMVTLVPENGSYVSDAETDTAMEALDISTRQTIRSTDICTRFSKRRYMILLMESGEHNVSDIMKRIFSSYYKIHGRSNLAPHYEMEKVHRHSRGTESRRATDVSAPGEEGN